MNLPDTFAAKVRAADCHVWIGSTNNKGYGIIQHDGRLELAHRVSYEAAYGPIPDGLVIDHLCRVRNCVRPDHLEAVTQRENQRRGALAGALAVGDTCQNGHLIPEGGLYERPSGRTECRACRGAGKANGPQRGRPTWQRRADAVRAELDGLSA